MEAADDVGEPMVTAARPQVAVGSSVWLGSFALDLLYGITLLVALPFLFYRRWRHGKTWSEFSSKIWGDVSIRPSEKPRLWFHAVSVGEVNLLPNLTSQLLAEMPDVHLVVSSTTATGLELARTRFANEDVIPFPLDFSWAVRRVLDRVQPRAIFLAELEIWPNLVRIAAARGIPVIVINGRLSEKSYRGYQRVRWLVHGIFARLTLVAAQDAVVAQRFNDLGVPKQRIHVTGSLKFDDAPTSRETPAVDAFRNLVGANANHRIWLAGSTQRGEEPIVLSVFSKLRTRYPQLRLICVPRHAERFDEVAELIESHGYTLVRRSQVHASRPAWNQDEVILVDSIGELRTWWGLADLAFVGGSLGNRGGQNMLEPAGYGAAVCFGPNTRNFRDIVQFLLSADAATVVGDAAELEKFVEDMVANPTKAERSGANARQVVLQHQGAIRQTVELLKEVAKG